MNAVVRWVLIIAGVLVVVGLVAFARGDDHRRGDEVGAVGVRAPLSMTLPG
jgi:hypothetical protein